MRFLTTLIAIQLVGVLDAQTYGSTYVKEGNVYVYDFNLGDKQLTYTGKDTLAFILKKTKEVLFIRNISEFSYDRKHIMKVNIDTYVEEVVADKKPYKDGLDGAYEILSIGDPVLTSDERYLYFIGEYAATGGALVQLDLSTKKWEALFSANSFQLIENGPFIGNFAIGRSEIRDRGRDAYYMIVDKSGKVLKEFADEEIMQKFLTGM